MAINIKIDDPRFWNSDVANLARMGLNLVRISSVTVHDATGEIVTLRGPALGREVERLTALADILREKYSR